MPMHRRTSARPPGTQGRKTSVKTNTFEIDFPKEKFTQYDVLMTTPATDRLERAKSEDKSHPVTLGTNPNRPKPPHPRYALEIMDFLQTYVDPETFNPRGAYDGQSNLFLWRPKIGAGRTWTFEMPEKSGRSYTVKLANVAEIKTNVLQELVRGIESPHSEIALAAVNVIVRMIPIQKNTPFYNKKSFFKVMQARTLGGGLELAEGWFQSVRPAMGKMLVNLDTTSTVVYKRGPLIEVCLDFIGENRPGVDVRSALSPNGKQMGYWLIKLKRFLKGRKVWNSETHPDAEKKTRGGRRRERIIEEIISMGAGDYIFPSKNGQSMSIQEHFATRNVRLRFPTIICVKLRSPPGIPIVMPIELLELVPGQMLKGRVPGEIASQMIKMTQARPAERLQNIHQGYQFMSYNGGYVTQTGMAVKNRPTEGNARILDHPRILYGGRLMPDGRTVDQNLEAVDVRDGSWNMLRKRLLQPAMIKAWAFIVFDPKYGRDSPTTIFGKFASPLQDALRLLGMTIVTSPFITAENPAGDIPRVLDTVYEATIARARQEVPQLEIQPNEVLFIAILSNPNVAVRDAFKRWGDISRGVPTQVVVGMKALNARDANSLNQYCNNLGLKINGKLGGINSTIKNAWFLEQPTMIIGADVSHPAPGSTMPSISAFVFTHDRRSCSDYFALSAVQESRLEKINDFGAMFKFALRRFDTTARAELQAVGRTPDPSRKYIPKRIVIYRDGVSEGEYKTVHNEEMGAIMKTFQELKEPPSKITFIVVGKRHHIRFFPGEGQPADRNGNCMSGLVVDTDIVHPVHDDFYLQSQKGLIGTSRSGHYTLLHDDNGFSSDTLQKLSFDLCHTFARSTSSVSIPAPVYYADLVCARSRYHFDSEVYGSESGDSGDGLTLDDYKRRYSNIHAALTKRMYFL